MKKTQIIEIGIEINGQDDFEFLQTLLTKVGFPYYVQPPTNPPWVSLEAAKSGNRNKPPGWARNKTVKQYLRERGNNGKTTK